jgi:hypothetical protein
MSAFQGRSHLDLVPPGLGMTRDQIEYLYMIYNDGVLGGKIKIMGDLPTKDTYNFLKEKSGYSGPLVIAFLMSLKDWAESHNSETWRNPILREGKEKIFEDSVTSIFTKPLDVASKAVGQAAKNVADPISKPLIAGAVIVGGVVILYGLYKTGLFKKLARK